MFHSGGTILADFLARTDGPIKDSKIHAAVRTTEQVKALAKLGVNVIQVDLTDENAVLTTVIDKKSTTLLAGQEHTS